MFPNNDSARAFAAERQSRFEAQAAHRTALRAAQTNRHQARHSEPRRFAFRRSGARAPARG